MDIYSRYINRGRINISFKDLSPNFFTFSWILIFLLLLLLLSYKLKKVYIIFLAIIFNFIFLLDAVYFNIFNNFPSFSDLSLVSEASEFSSDVISYIGYKNIIISIFSIVFVILCCKTVPRTKKKSDIYVFGASLLLIIICYNYAVYNLGTITESSWDKWKNRRYIYEFHNDSKTAYMLSGLYEYIAKDFYITFLKETPFDKKQAIDEVNQFIKNNPKEHSGNQYTGLFKDKNLILVMLETIEDWMITEKNMPTLNKILKEGINFNNHYSTNYVTGYTFNTEFIANTGLIPSGDSNILTAAYSKNKFDSSLPKLFKNDDYLVNSYHKNVGSFYNRENFHINIGYEKYYNAGNMNIPKDYSGMDSYMIKKGFQKIIQNDKFMSFVITYSAHMPYRYNKLECSSNLDYVKQYIDSSDEDYLCAMAQSHETDNFFTELLKKLEEENKIDNTVIIGFADHYAYGFNKELLYNLKDETDFNLLQKTPFFIWSNDIEPLEVKKVSSTVDILPTIANLFGLNWNPNYYIGNDALDQNYKGFAFFKDHSWYDGSFYYKSSDNYSIDKSEYIDLNNNYVLNQFEFSKNIIMSDYFRNKK